jgi:hypothetical protein
MDNSAWRFRGFVIAAMIFFILGVVITLFVFLLGHISSQSLLVD